MGCLLDGSVYWWTEMEGFRFVDEGSARPGGVGLSASGNALVATREGEHGPLATIWYLDGSSIDLDPIVRACQDAPMGSSGLGLSADGSLAVVCDSDCETEQGFLWEARTGATPLADAGSGARAVTCSDDGSTFVGYGTDPESGLQTPVLWRADGRAERFLGTGPTGLALDVSADGGAVVGQASSAP